MGSPVYVDGGCFCQVETSWCLGLEKGNGIQNGFELEKGCGMVYNE